MEAATQAREREKEKKATYRNQKGQEAAESETVYNEAIKGTLEKTAALEKHVKKR